MFKINETAMIGLLLNRLKIGIPVLLEDRFGFQFCLIKTGDKELDAVYFSPDVDTKAAIIRPILRSNSSTVVTVKDWFEEETNCHDFGARGLTCTCDKYEMMRYGCKCGAIVPYELRMKG